MAKESEIWKRLDDYPDYEISNWGRLRDLPRVINWSRGRSRKMPGYKIMTLNVSGKSISRHYLFKTEMGIKREKISRLVYKTFIGPLDPNLVIDHKDNNPRNDYVGNLQQITVRLNNSKDRKNKTSKYTGVCINMARKNRGLSRYWVGKITVNGKTKHLGYFDSAIEASKAYKHELNLIEDDSK